MKSRAGFTPNLVAIAAFVLSLLLIDGAVNSRSPIEVMKAILQGKPLPQRGSGKGASGTSGGTTGGGSVTV